MREFVRLYIEQLEEHRRTVDIGEIPKETEAPLPSIPYVSYGLVVLFQLSLTFSFSYTIVEMQTNYDQS